MIVSKKRSSIILNILLIFFLSIFIVSGYFLYKEIKVYKQGSDEYSSWVDLAISTPSVPKDTPKADVALMRVVDFKKLSQVNPDVVGWIYIPDTVVDYPVVQCDNNDKYLNTLFSGETNKAGAIFVDYRNKMNFNDDNTIIYGHNMKNKSMFHILSKYSSQDFYDKHNIIYYYTLDGVYELRVFSAYTVHATDSYTDISFKNQRTDRINKLIERSSISSAFTVGAEDKIASLSTCAYDFDDARFVVHATVHKMEYGKNN